MEGAESEQDGAGLVSISSVDSSEGVLLDLVRIVRSLAVLGRKGSRDGGTGNS